MPRKILFLVPYPLRESPSQRFRFEQYFELLGREGAKIEIQSFLNSHNWQVFFNSGNTIGKATALINGFVKRIAVLFRAPVYDFIFVHREITPIGPPIFEWILSKILRKRIIYDFDDAIWLTDRDQETWIVKTLKWRVKVKWLCKWSYKVSCGNEYLRAYAKQYNSSVFNNPTTIDTQFLHNPDLYKKEAGQHDQVVVGWTGSHSTLKYLYQLESILQKIECEFPMISIVIIADRKPPLQLKSLIFIPWNEKTEIEDLNRIDIGIMPLPDDEWSKGKCGFKVLQYMALKIPAVASSVGVNSTIIDNEKEGFLCATPIEWEEALTKLILNEDLRKNMGEIGRKKVIEHYSVISNSSNFLSLFE